MKLLRYLKRMLFWWTALLCATLIFVFESQAGLDLALAITKNVVPGKLSYHYAVGSLATGVQVKDLSYASKHFNFTVTNASFNIHLLPLLRHHLAIKYLIADDAVVNITLDATPQQPAKPFELPLTISSHQTELKRLLLNIDTHAWLQTENLKLKAKIAPHSLYADASWQTLHIHSISQLFPSFVSGSLQLQGPPANYQLNINTELSDNMLQFKKITAKAQGEYLQLQATDINIDATQGNINASGKLSLQNNIAWQAKIILKNYNINRKLDDIIPEYSLQLKTNGSYQQHHYQGDIDLEALQLPNMTSIADKSAKLQGRIVYNNRGITTQDLKWQNKSILVQVLGGYEKAWNVAWHIKLANLTTLLPSINGSLQSDGKITGPLKTPQITTTVDANNISYRDYAVKWLHLAWQASLPFSSNHAVSCTAQQLLLHDITIDQLTLQLLANLPQQLFNITLNTPSNVVFNVSGQQYKIPLTKAHSNITLNPQGLALDVGLQFLADNTLSGQLLLPQYQAKQLPALLQSIQGKIDLQIHDLALLSHVFPQLQATHGKLTSQIKIDGTLWRPQLQGELLLQQASVALPTPGLQLHDINASCHFNQDGIFKLDGTLRSGDGNLHFSGNGQSALNHLAIDLHIDGNHLLTVNNSDARIVTSPHLTVATHNNSIAINGSITVDKAYIHPLSLGKDILQASDVVLVDQQKSSAVKHLNYNLSSNIQLILGKEVFVDYSGLHAQLAGELHITDSSETLATAMGTIQTVQGKYLAYGQELKILHGRLLFTGGFINNPGIDVQATKIINTTSQQSWFNLQQKNFSSSLLMSQTPKLLLGVNVSHTLKEPVINFFSEPSGLSQTDILSYLLTGRPIDQATALDQRTIITAVSTLNLTGVGGINSLTSDLKKTFGLSELSIQDNDTSSSSQDVLHNTSLVLGKYLTSRLFVSYSIGLLSTMNTWRARYSLTPNWVIQAETNTLGRGIDLFYSIER